MFPPNREHHFHYPAFYTSFHIGIPCLALEASPSQFCHAHNRPSAAELEYERAAC